MAEDRFAAARERMIREQILDRGLTDRRVLDAIRAVPRHEFVPPELADAAYADSPLHIGLGQTISQPYMVALMTHLLELTEHDRVLEIGAGSGYQAAILSRLCAEVITIERRRGLAERAELRLRAQGLRNVTVLCGDGSAGYAPAAPYDGIVVTAAGPVVPPPLIAQLAEGGRLVCPAGGRNVQTLYRMVRRAGRVESEPGIQCTFVPLVGERGWPADTAG